MDNVNDSGTITVLASARFWVRQKGKSGIPFLASLPPQVGVRSAYLPSLDPTMCDYTGYVVLCCVVLENQSFSVLEDYLEIKEHEFLKANWKL